MPTTREDDLAGTWTLDDARVIGSGALTRHEFSVKDFFDCAWEIPRRERRGAVEQALRRAIGSGLLAARGRHFSALPALKAVLNLASATARSDFMAADDDDYVALWNEEVLGHLSSIPVGDSDWRLSEKAYRQARRAMALEQAWVVPLKLIVIPVFLVIALLVTATRAGARAARSLVTRAPKR